MNTYTWNAEDYEKHSHAQQKWAKELISKLNLNGSEDVLDLGCGDGKVTFEISSLLSNGSVVGVDNSKTMIKLATNQYPGITFVVMDARNLSFENTFDMVYSNAALHWVKNHKPVVNGLFKCLKPGGKLLLQMGGKGNAEYILSVLEEIQSNTEWRQYFDKFEFPYGFLGIDEYEKLLLESNFNINRLVLIPKDMEHVGKSGLEGWIRTTWLPYTERIPEEKRNRFIETISKKYIERVPMDANGLVHVSMVRLEVEAEKSV